MAFGRMGSLGRGFGAFGSLGGAAGSGGVFPDSAFTAAGGFLRFEASNPSNGATALEQTFTPGDVNTTTNKIALADQGFGAFSTYASAKATRGWFGTTGTLPACSNATLTPGTASSPGTIVYRVDDGAGGATFYKESADADYATLPGAISGEVVRRAQRYAQAVDALDFTDGGSGTHTFYTWPITASLTSMGASAYKAEGTTGDKNTWFEIETDSNGKQRIFSEKFCTDPATGSYRGYGKTFPLGPAALRSALQAEVAQKRWVWHVAVVRGEVEREKSYRKISVASGAGVDTTNDLITKAGHPFATANAVKFKAWPSSSVPGGVDDDVTTYYVRVATNDLTFHPTANDATNNTNKIDLTSAGGNFTVYAPQRVGDGTRWRFPIEHLNPNNDGGNILTERADQENNTLVVSTAFSIATGTTAGEITGSQTFLDGTQVYVFVPIGTTMPTCSDTSAALAGGTYYTSTVGGKLRLHRSLDSALRSIDVATASSDCIKFSVAGTGECAIYFDDDTIAWALDQERSGLAQFTTRVPVGRNLVICSIVDYDDAAATGVMAYMGLNTTNTQSIDLTTEAKGLTQAAAGTGSPGTLLNSAASHVAWNGGMYAFCGGAGTGAVPFTDIQSVIDYYVSQLSATITAPVNTVAPTGSSAPKSGEAINGSVGTWTGANPKTWAFQWQNADDSSGTNAADISGATSLIYTPVSGDLNKYLRLKVTSTNTGGSAIAYSAWSSSAVSVSGEAEVAALDARRSTPFSTDHRAAAKSYIEDLKLAGVWSKLDGLYLFRDTNSTDYLLNWIANNAGTVTGGVTFTAKSGVAGNGTTGYIDTGINPSTAGGNYAQNSASIGVRVNNNVTSNGRAIAIAAATTRCYLLLRTAGEAFNCLLNASSGTYTQSSVTTSVGYHAALRRSSTAIDLRLDNTARASAFSQTSAIMSNGTIRFMNDSGAAFYTGELSMGFFGGGLTTAESDALYSATETYLAAVAALP